MKFATLKGDTLDGRLVLVSRDSSRAMAVPHIAPTLLDAIQRWDWVNAALVSAFDMLNAGAALYAANVSNSIQAGVLLAKSAIESGAAKAKLEQFSVITKQLSN